MLEGSTWKRCSYCMDTVSRRKGFGRSKGFCIKPVWLWRHSAEPGHCAGKDCLHTILVGLCVLDRNWAPKDNSSTSDLDCPAVTEVPAGSHDVSAPGREEGYFLPT